MSTTNNVLDRSAAESGARCWTVHFGPRGRSDWAQVAQALGKSGSEMPGGVYRVGLPRSDLKVTLECRGQTGARAQKFNPFRANDW